MKQLLIPISVFALLIACANTTSPDNNETSKTILVSDISEKDTIINFESDSEGQLPKGFTQTATGAPQELNWKVVSDNGNKVAAQQAKNSGGYFNLLILDKPGYKDLHASVRIKAVAGNEDQGGGLVWRYKDNNNYYVARYNPLEENFRFYKVVNGSRKQLKSVNSHTKSGEWFIMQVDMKGNKITCSLNSQQLIEATDNTFPSAGRVGFWTKADAQSYFDEFSINPSN